MTLATRILLAASAVLVGTQVVLGVIVVERTRSNLVAQVDDRLVGPLSQHLDGTTSPSTTTATTAPPDPSGADPEPQPGAGRLTAYLEFAPDGTPTVVEASGPDTDPDPLPDVPSSIADAGTLGVARTVASVDHTLDYRALFGETEDGGLAVAAFPLTGVDDTVASLVRTMAWWGLAATVVALGLLWLVLRRGLRPVGEMAATATRIAAGDRSVRVTTTAPRSELGRLAAALDDMIDQLQSALSATERSQAQLRAFVADASHELATPLTSIRGYAELYRRGGLADRASLDAAMARVESEATRMGVLVADLLVLARLDEDRPLELEAVDVTGLCAEAVADALAADPGRRLDLEADGEHLVVADGDRLRQVVANLLRNVRAHTPPGTPAAVTVTGDDGAAGDDGAGPAVVVTVADEGPGIDPELLPRLFDRFSQGAADGAGSGLGLAIVAAIVDAHGGTVSAGDRPRGGARFTVRLPVAGPPVHGRGAATTLTEP